MADACTQCGGTGKCPDCQGTGFDNMRACVYCDPPGQCPRCHGKRFEARSSGGSGGATDVLGDSIRRTNKGILDAIHSELGAAMRGLTPAPRSIKDADNESTCSQCDGAGEIDCIQCYGSGKHGADPGKPCVYCNGSGRQACPDCGGSGHPEP